MKKYLYKVAIWPLRLYWFLFRPVSHGVKCIVFRNDGKILFIQNTYGKGWWNFPGGGRKKDETAEAAVVREVSEEVGLDLKDLRMVGHFLSTLEYKRDNIDVFAARTDGEIYRTQAAEIKDHQWLNPSEPPLPLATVAKRALALLLDNRRP